MRAFAPAESSPAEIEELQSCPNCRGGRLDVWCKGRDRLYELSEQEFVYSECSDCGVIFLSVRPVESAAHKFYPSNYGPYQSQAVAGPPAKSPAPARDYAPALLKGIAYRALRFVNSAVTRLSPDTFQDEFWKFYRLPEGGGRLLDFGCGSDAFLNRAREQGWDTLGMDFSPQTIEQVRRSGHKAILLSQAAWAEVEDESLDLVRMNHVLEHIYNAREVLSSIRSKMKPGGRLHIALPNPHSFTSRMFRSRWFSLDCPRHVILYPPDALLALLREVGFSDFKILHETLTKDFSRSLGYVLYERGRIGHEGVEGMMHRQSLSELLYAPARLAAVLGAADRFHTFVRK